ncbi:enolase 1 [Artemisia annua]|uniref:phosphopyruvate hydratase n=1 Tax=Artemisia annua TaxID=35608 RepID=A0A2U1MTN2_ARTAN|nr:enolase 1 [Artemisia annua]
MATVKKVLEDLHKDYALLVAEKDITVFDAAMSQCMGLEKRVRFPKKKTKPGDEVLTTSANVPQVAEDESEEAKVVAKVKENRTSNSRRRNGHSDDSDFENNVRKYNRPKEISTAIAKAGYIDKVVIGMDVIASEFYGKKDKTYADYFMQNINGKEKISGEQLKDLYKSFMSEYPIVSIEDPFDQDDWEDYAKMTVECGEQERYEEVEVWIRQLEKQVAPKQCRPEINFSQDTTLMLSSMNLTVARK